MKNKLVLTLVAITMVFASNSAKAQAFAQGTTHVNVGFGLGGYLSYASFGDFRSTPTLFLAVDHGVMDDLGPGSLGIGGFLAYKAASYDYNVFGYNETGKWTDFVIGARGTYHYYIDNEQIDLYAGLSLGLVIESYDYTSTYAGGIDDDFYDYNDNFVYYAFSVGGKYMFTENLGAFAELGYDIAWLKLGVTLGL
jgi:hypothetical protein